MRLRLRVTPKASRNALGGLQADAEGQVWMKVAVTAVPEGGKANQAVIKLLAKAMKWPKSAFSVVSGATDRWKILLIEGDTDRLSQELSTLVEKHNG